MFSTAELIVRILLNTGPKIAKPHKHTHTHNPVGNVIALSVHVNHYLGLTHLTHLSLFSPFVSMVICAEERKSVT